MVKDPLDEWIYYYKNNNLPPCFAAKGLDKVEAQLKVDDMTTQVKMNYVAHLKSLAISHSMLETLKIEGTMEGELQGRLEGRTDQAIFTAEKLIQRGFSNEEIAE